MMLSVDQILTPDSLQKTLMLFAEVLALIEDNPSIETPAIGIESEQFKMDESTMLSDDQVLNPDSFQEALRLFADNRSLIKNNSSKESPSIVTELELYRKDGSTIFTKNSI